MKLLLLAGLIVVGLTHPLELSENELVQWESFKVKYMKEYENPEEEARRMNIFANHLKFIHEHNAKYEDGEVTFKVAVNKFADLSNEEFRARMNGYRRPAVRSGMTFNLTSDGENAASVDWRKEGAVTPVKDQGQCNSGWAFSTTGSIESQFVLKTQIMVELSEQNLVDCTVGYGNSGCSGGVLDFAFKYIINNDGIDTEESYPYIGLAWEGCNFTMGVVGARIRGYVDVTSGSERHLETAVRQIGPISVAIDASNPAFQLYDSGIYNPDDCSTTNLYHAVLVVGYENRGFLFKNNYWIVKNSWGTDWGLSGYFMLAKDKNNKCGVATEASYPVM